MTNITELLQTLKLIIFKRETSSIYKKIYISEIEQISIMGTRTLSNESSSTASLTYYCKNHTESSRTRKNEKSVNEEQCFQWVIVTNSESMKNETIEGLWVREENFIDWTPCQQHPSYTCAWTITSPPKNEDEWKISDRRVMHSMNYNAKL